MLFIQLIPSGRTVWGAGREGYKTFRVVQPFCHCTRKLLSTSLIISFLAPGSQAACEGELDTDTPTRRRG